MKSTSVNNLLISIGKEKWRNQKEFVSSTAHSPIVPFGFALPIFYHAPFDPQARSFWKFLNVTWNRLVIQPSFSFITPSVWNLLPARLRNPPPPLHSPSVQSSAQDFPFSTGCSTNLRGPCFLVSIKCNRMCIYNFFTCRISLHGHCHDLPCLNKFISVVLSCFTLSRQTSWTEALLSWIGRLAQTIVQGNCLCKVIGQE